MILTEIQISQSTALICCISDVTHPLHTCVYLTEMQTVSNMISTQPFIGAAPYSCVNPRHTVQYSGGDLLDIIPHVWHNFGRSYHFSYIYVYNAQNTQKPRAGRSCQGRSRIQKHNIDSTVNLHRTAESSKIFGVFIKY